MLYRMGMAGAFLVLPGLAHAEAAKTAPAAGGMNCPMMGDTASLQKGMGGMMADMSAMMKDVSDPAMKARMQKMHEQMAMMSANMRKMGGGMMGGGMGGMMQARPDAAAPPAKPDDHAHHNQ
jgi:hypothetical protein